MNEIRLEEPLGHPIFVLSCERSGSTLLRYLIDTHSKICCPGEITIGNLCANLSTLLFRTVGQAWNQGNERLSGEIAVEETRRLVSGVMNAYARGKQKSRWCDKTPLNLFYLEAIEMCFPDAQYICLYRNCMDVVNSCLDVSKLGFMRELSQYVATNPGNLVYAMINSWLEKTTKLLNFEKNNNKKCFRIQYESIVTKPNAILPEMFRFFNLEWEPRILDRVFLDHHDQGGGDYKIHSTRDFQANFIGKGKFLPLNNIPLDCLSKVNEVLSELGYPKIDK
jgi:protein-tyrosine sulfotransferase